MFDDLLDAAIDILKTFGINKTFWADPAAMELIESANIIASDKEDAFVNGYELATYLLEGMTSVFKETALHDNEAGFHSTPDGRLITSVVASNDGLQEEALNLIPSAKGHSVIDIYQEVLQPLNLHCPTCACETEIKTYEEVVETREEYLEKLKDVLGKEA